MIIKKNAEETNIDTHSQTWVENFSKEVSLSSSQDHCPRFLSSQI